MPSLHCDHMQIGADPVLGVKHLGELPYCHRVTYRHGEGSGEGNPVGIKHRTFDYNSGERIGTIEDKEWDVVFGGCFHAVSHCGDVGIETHAGVLNVEDKGIDVSKHRLCWPANVAIETVNW